jgi:uncharacterized protein YndB with AHSA1/START domain
MLPAVERSLDLDVSPDALWRAITDDAELATWFAPEAALDARVGGHGRFVDDDGIARQAVVEALEPGHRLVLRWWPDSAGPAAASVVTLVVAPRPGGARLHVTEHLAASARADFDALAEASRTAWMWRLDLLLLRVAVMAAAPV